MEEHKQTVVVTCLVRNAAEQILLIRHVRRGWELPQGRVEPGETLTNAVVREVLEETGVQVELEPLAAIWSKVCPPQAIVFGFTGKYRSGELTASEESPEVRWFTPEAACSVVAHQVNLDRLQTLLSHGGILTYNAYQSRPFTVLTTRSLLHDLNPDAPSHVNVPNTMISPAIA